MVTLLRYLFLLFASPLLAEVKLGVECFFEQNLDEKYLHGKNIALISNQTAVTSKCETTLSILLRNSKNYKLRAIFAPEHGFHGDSYACAMVTDQKLGDIPIYSLHGEHRRPNDLMLKDIDVLIYDIQDIGTRSYTFISTLFYCMEEAAKMKLPFIIFDRPNPMGEVIDGPDLQDNFRSFLGYINVPYCHGMTVGELAQLFNEEYNIGCQLIVIPMKRYKRSMTFDETQLPWIPTSPQIPEASTAYFYPTTGLLGHLSFVNIGIGYTLPFKIVGAPWINPDLLCAHLNKENLPGVIFQPTYFRPFFGLYQSENCRGANIIIKDPKNFLPVTTQVTILAVIKRLYPEKVEAAFAQLETSKVKKELFFKLLGGREIYDILKNESLVIWKLREKFVKVKENFLQVRKKYLITQYDS